MGQDSRCINCGYDIEKDYILYINGTEFTFDSFECAINFVAPRCAHCNTIVMGRGVHKNDSGDIYCCTNCSEAMHHAQVVP